MSERYEPSAASTADASRGVGGTGVPAIPTLTVAYHPALERVGQRVLLPELLGRREVALSRVEPVFTSPDGEAAGPLADACVSRRPLRLRGDGRGGVVVSTRDAGSACLADGCEVAGEYTASASSVDRGVVLEVGRGIVLVLHRLPPPAPGVPRFGMVGESASILALRATCERVAGRDVSVLIEGESGSGKELVAAAIHQASGRRGAPMVSVNMAAVPGQTAASELFGHVRGAFTGASGDRTGLLRQADRGTLFLDEVADTPPDVQLMLLRAIETGEFRRLGGTRTEACDVRVVAATDQDLDALCETGAFREALLHRLAGYRVRVPALRERVDDIPRLVVAFLPSELATSEWLPPGVMVRLLRHGWPGNVRELRNALRRLVIDSDGQRWATPGAGWLPGPMPTLDPGPGEGPASDNRTAPRDIDEVHLLEALRANAWRPAATARALGIARSSLYLLIDGCPAIRKAGDLSVAELERAHAEHGGDVSAMVAALEVSQRGLKRRLAELGVGSSSSSG